MSIGRAANQSWRQPREPSAESGTTPDKQTLRQWFSEQR